MGGEVKNGGGGGAGRLVYIWEGGAERSPERSWTKQELRNSLSWKSSHLLIFFLSYLVYALTCCFSLRVLCRAVCHPLHTGHLSATAADPSVSTTFQARRVPDSAPSPCSKSKKEVVPFYIFAG